MKIKRLLLALTILVASTMPVQAKKPLPPVDCIIIIFGFCLILDPPPECSGPFYCL